MAKTDYHWNNFSAGELNPLAYARGDFERYQRGARILENFRVLQAGGIQARRGTHYVATAHNITQPVRLAPFVFRNVDAMVLEFGHLYVRFYKANTLLTSGASPYVLGTPYDASDVFQLRLTPKNDVIYITHRSYEPRKLQRIADNNWQLSTANPYPPPTYEAGVEPNIALTLSGLSGAVTVTAASPVFLSSDVDREIVSDTGRGIITGYTSSTVVTMLVVDAFPSVSIAAGNWLLTASPMAGIKPSVKGPRGASVTLTLRKEQEGGTELITTGASDMTGWTDQSGPVFLTGTHNGASGATEVQDTTANFVAASVQPGMRVRNTTDVNVSSVNTVTATILTLTAISGGTDNDFDTGDTYNVHKTGSAQASQGGITLNGGISGVGWIERVITTVAGTAYRVKFDVSGSPVSFQAGSTSLGSDVAVEASYVVGNEHEVIFTAETTTTYIQFKNSQQSDATVKNIGMKIYAIDGWRASDVGKFVYLNGGLVRLTAFTSAQVMQGIIISVLDSDLEAAAGAWTLESHSWSAANGYPALGQFHEQRFLLASSPKFPHTIWGSRSADFENFARLPLADAAFSYTMADAQGLLNWMVSADQLIIGAENSEFRFGLEPLSAITAPLIRAIGDYGSAPVEPLRIGTAILFAQRQGSKLRELFFDETQQTYDAADVTLLSGHLLETGRIVQMAFEKEPLPTVWAVRNDGVLLGLTYDRKERIAAWHRHVLGGDGAVESVAIIPHPGLNAYQVWLVVRRTISGIVTRYIERISDVLQGCDAGVHYDDVSELTQTATTSTLGQLTHLNGETVAIAGIPLGGQEWTVFPSQVVSGGGVTVNTVLSRAYAGLPFSPTAETLDPVGPEESSIQRRKKRWVELYTRLHQTGEGLFLNNKPIVTRLASHLPEDGVPLWSDDFRLVNLGYDVHARITVTMTTPLPCTLLMVGGSLEVGDS